SLRSSRSSMPRNAWLSAEGDSPSSTAARLKLRCRAMLRKIARSDGETRCFMNFPIYEFYSQAFSKLWGLSHQSLRPTVHPTRHTVCRTNKDEKEKHHAYMVHYGS